jgi:hypothetical protein
MVPKHFQWSCTQRTYINRKIPTSLVGTSQLPLQIKRATARCRLKRGVPGPQTHTRRVPLRRGARMGVDRRRRPAGRTPESIAWGQAGRQEQMAQLDLREVKEGTAQQHHVRACFALTMGRHRRLNSSILLRPRSYAYAGRRLLFTEHRWSMGIYFSSFPFLYGV